MHIHFSKWHPAEPEGKPGHICMVGLSRGEVSSVVDNLINLDSEPDTAVANLVAQFPDLTGGINHDVEMWDLSAAPQPPVVAYFEPGEGMSIV